MRKHLLAFGALACVAAFLFTSCAPATSKSKQTKPTTTVKDDKLKKSNTAPSASDKKDNDKNDGVKSAENTGDDKFPYNFKNFDGSITTIPKKPVRILSASVTLTGIAMPLKPPIIASSTAANGDFFPAWKKDAEAANIKKLWKVPAPADMEAVAAAKPDLILVSPVGGDKLTKQLDQFKKIAPTIVINYTKYSWQEVMQKLGRAFGMTKEAKAALAKFDSDMKDLASKITPPKSEVNVLFYSGPTGQNAVALREGPYGQFLTKLGFNVEQPKKEWSKRDLKRNDFVFAAHEHLTELKGETSFLIFADDKVKDKMLSDPVLANVPSVVKKQVYPLGRGVFRLDYYSSHQFMKFLEKLYAKK